MNRDMPLIVNINHAIGVIMLTLLNYIFRLKYFLESNNKILYRIPYSILTYLALRCNLDVLRENISTLLNYNLSLPML